MAGLLARSRLSGGRGPFSSDSGSKSSFIFPQTNRTFASGQAVLEYVLLLGVALAISLIIMDKLIGTSSDPNGVRKAWVNMINWIGKDVPDGP